MLVGGSRYLISSMHHKGVHSLYFKHGFQTLLTFYTQYAGGIRIRQHPKLAYISQILLREVQKYLVIKNQSPACRGE